MSERPDNGDGRRRRRSRRRKRRSNEGASESPSGDATPRTPPNKEGRTREERPQTSMTLKSPKALERLRTRVEAAAAEIERLRRENAELAARVSELEERPAMPDDAALLALDEDPEALEAKLTAFVEAIDQYLATEADRGRADAE